MRHANRMFMAAIALTFPAFALAGCSSGKSTLSKADFISKADAICAATTAKVNTIPQLSTTPTEAEVVSSVQQVLAIVEPALAQLAALHASPSDLAVLTQNLISPTNAQDASAQALITALQQANGNSAAEKAAIKKFSSATVNPAQASESSALADFGFVACSKTSQSA